MFILHRLDFSFLFGYRLGIDVGIFSVECCKDLGDGLGEDTGVWIDHAREVFVIDGLINLPLDCCFN